MNTKKMFSLALLLTTPFVFADTKSITPVKSAVTGEIKVTSSDVKTGYFNSAQAVSESKLGKEAYAEIEKKRQSYETAFKKGEEAYTKKIKDLQAKASTMSTAAKQKAEEELMQMKGDLEHDAKSYEEKLKLAMNQAQDRIFTDLTEAVLKAGKAAGKDVMIDIASGRVYPINADKVNATNMIVANMDAAYGKQAPKKTASA